MRRRPLHPLRFCITDFHSSLTAVSMSSFRGGRNYPRRNFSDRPIVDGRRGHYISDDSHFRPGREANLGSHNGEGGSFRTASEFPLPDRPSHPNQNHQFRPHLYQNQQQFRPRFYQNHQQFRPPPTHYNYQNQQFRRSPAPPFQHNQPRRVANQYQPRPRPPDFRNWEFAKTSPPSTSERFTILSYNILADYLATDHRSRLYYHIPPYMLDWQWRKKNILFELGLWSADIICFQEVDRFQELEEGLRLRGYTGVWKRRTGVPIDGCAIFWRSSRFKLLHEESIEFNKLGLRDNVAQICVLELLSRNCDENAATLPTSSTNSNKVVVCNIHVLFNPKRGDIKLGQVRTLLDRAHAVSKIWNDAPVVLCGDFNCVPKIDLSVVDRNKLSGQASAEIREQRTYNPNYGVISGDYSFRAPSMVQGNKVVKMNESSLDMEKPFDLDSSTENVPLVENSSHSHNALSVNDRSSTSLIHERNDAKVGDEVKEETQEILVHDPSDSLRKDICTPYCEGGSSTGNLNHEKTDNMVNVLFGGSSESTNYSEEESKSCDNVLQSLPDVTCSSMVETASEAYCQTISSCDDNRTSPQNSEDLFSLQVSSDRQGDSSGTSQTHLAFSPTNIDVQEKVDTLTLDETMTGEGNIAEDSTTFLSALHNYEEDFSCDPDQLLRSDTTNSNPLSNIGVEGDLSTDLDPEQPIEVEKFFYDPSLWTPADIETATGDAKCTFVEHPLKLKSTYTEVEDCLGTRDSNGEPLVTSYHRCFLGTVDYIWRSEGLQTVKVLSPIPKHVMQTTSGFPTKKWGSDHIALASELAFVKEDANHKIDVQQFHPDPAKGRIDPGDWDSSSLHKQTMSWLARSIANSLKLDDNDDDDHQPNVTASKSSPAPNTDAHQTLHLSDSPTHSQSSSSSSTPTPKGVKDDISELTQTLTRQFWGVASFLAPPPESSPSPPAAQISNSGGPSDEVVPDEDVIAGIRSDFAEIGGRFRSGISKLSSNKAVSEFTKIASNLLQLGEEDELEARGSVGVTDEVLAFARNIAMHPETWLDFPFADDEDSDDFELSDAQQEHALAVERLAPRLAALRIELCPGHMTEGHFWKIYFVLLHPRLNRYDAELLSTPEIVEARAILTQELQVRAKGKTQPQSSSGIVELPKVEHLSVPSVAQAEYVPIVTHKPESAPSARAVDLETEKYPVQSTEIKVIDKAVIEEGPANSSKYQGSTSGSSSKVLDDKFEDDGDDWLKDEENSEIVGVSGTSIPIGNDEDVSFSDLEDDDDDADVPVSYKKTTSGSDSSTKDSRDWVQLSRGSADSDKEVSSIEVRHGGSEQAPAKEGNDWLDVDDIDVM
ncbi:hypothetical protein F8388_017319 [Cannabis sativa]|uniref:BSD domain-containing protein n=1 Tax=Cannabis sativa TaxID=3483 RepID=A0A7J6FWN9_CANSA|nr:hypothetical protein F8388_017319 [Cannabis sativa]